MLRKFIEGLKFFLKLQKQTPLPDPKTLVFQLTPENCQEFWDRVIQKDLKTEVERKELLIQMAKEGKIKAVYATGRDKKEIVEGYKKQFGKVWDLTENGENK